jgi:hypothetical protein
MPRDLISSVRDFSDEQDTLGEHNVEPMDDAQRQHFEQLAREMVLTQEQKKRVAKRESELKPTLMKMLERHGLPYGEEGQHQTVEFAKPIRGIARFVRQRKVLRETDEVKAEAIARRKDLYERLFKPVMMLDEDAVVVAREQGLLTDDEVEEMFPKKIQYAFVPEKAKKK